MSGLEVTVDGLPGEHIATRRDGSSIVFTTLLRHVGRELARTPDPQVRLDQVRGVRPGRLGEELWLSSTLDAAVRVEIAVTLTGDATPVELVKDGRPPSGWSSRPTATPCAGSRTTSLWRSSPPARPRSCPRTARRPRCAGRSSCRPAAGRASPGAWLPTNRPGWVAAPATPAPPPPAATVSWSDHRLGRWLDRALADLRSLRMATPQAPDDVFYAAGAPWYLTLFGRDSLWAARMTLPVDRSVALGTLADPRPAAGHERRPAYGRAARQDPARAAPAGFTLGEMVLPPLYYGTVDATALWVCLLHDAWAGGAERRRDPRAAPRARGGAGLAHRAR